MLNIEGGRKMENNLRFYREQSNMTQQLLSKISEVSRTTISQIENGQLKNIKSNTMIKLAVALNCDISDIFFKENVVLTQQK